MDKPIVKIMKKKLLISIIMLILSLIMVTTTILGWFLSGAFFDDIIITTGVIKVEGVLYYIHDFDKNGILDVVDGENVYTSISSPNIVDFKPGEMYSYKIDIENKGNIDGLLTVYFIGIPEGMEEVLSYNSIVYDYNDDLMEDEGTGASRVSLADSIILAEDIFLSYEEDENMLSVYFTIKFETLDSLKISNPLVFQELDNLNDYQNIDFNDFKIVLNLVQYQ